MRKIYLASDSKARKKLLTILGLRFKVLPSKIKEEKMSGLSYAGLVKHNALAKAKDVAKRIKQGIVIGADTIVVQGKKIFGKPKNLNEAQSILKQLSRKPHSLYTGIAVIDTDNKKTRLAYEKTKVYMDGLTDSEIKKYFSVVSALDKAGGFDIQGKGAFFVRRIEGCFYNVVGLPLRRLYRMLKEMGMMGRQGIGVRGQDSRVRNQKSGKGIFLFCFLFSVIGLSGCSTEYNIVTGQEEMYFYSTDKEVQMGIAIAKQVEEEYKPVEDPLIQKRVNDIGKKIASACDRKEIDYQFKVLEDEEVNAVSLPGGFVYVNKGLIERIANDDELAAVLAHEVGHIVARHSIKKLQAVMGYSFLRILAIATPAPGEISTTADAAFTELILGYSREDELLADRLGARYTKSAGYNPRGMITFLEKLQEINRKKPLRPKTYFKTHPYVPDRIRVVKEELGENISFTDYINVEQRESNK